MGTYQVKETKRQRTTNGSIITHTKPTVNTLRNWMILTIDTAQSIIMHIVFGGRFMVLNCDRFFIAELKAAGYDLDFKKIQNIYGISREKHQEEILKGKMKYKRSEAMSAALAAEVVKKIED